MAIVGEEGQSNWPSPDSQALPQKNTKAGECLLVFFFLIAEWGARIQLSIGISYSPSLWNERIRRQSSPAFASRRLIDGPKVRWETDSVPSYFWLVKLR